MFDDFGAWFVLKLKDWGLLIMAVTASTVSLSMGLGWTTIFRRCIFSSITALVIACTCYYGFELAFAVSFACGYFLSFVIESAFRQRLDAMGRAIAAKAITVVKNFPIRKNNGDSDD